jgi:hypothetical protein
VDTLILTIWNITQKMYLVPGPLLQFSSEASKFGPRRANWKMFLATCKKTKYTGMRDQFISKLVNIIKLKGYCFSPCLWSRENVKVMVYIQYVARSCMGI